MRVLGVDPGLTRCGVAVIDGAPGQKLTAVHIGVLRTSPDAELAQRLVLLEQGLIALVEEFKPDAVAIERVFSQHNVRSAMATAQAAGVALLVAGRCGIQVSMHTPTEVKAAVTGSGRADKDQVNFMVTRLLGLSEAPKPADAADALAIAICDVWRGTAKRRLAAAVRGA
ncbi:MAG: crossover junction endodeoxyribonuclease RuvC [Actinomycetota bacterium]|nr:crossover junction endodeoxyribonuclease RuvC [Actinomycetota bacterium]